MKKNEEKKNSFHELLFVLFVLFLSSIHYFTHFLHNGNDACAILIYLFDSKNNDNNNNSKKMLFTHSWQLKRGIEDWKLWFEMNADRDIVTNGKCEAKQKKKKIEDEKQKRNEEIFLMYYV